jgi:molybdopterin converting factor small subunit
MFVFVPDTLAPDAEALASKLSSEIEELKESEETVANEETVKFSKPKNEVLSNGTIVPLSGPVVTFTFQSSAFTIPDAAKTARSARMIQ